MSKKYDVAVIGSGSGGSEAVLLVAEQGSKAIVMEKETTGVVNEPTLDERWPRGLRSLWEFYYRLEG
jgi:flavin-dependent dehydrogenase